MNETITIRFYGQLVDITKTSEVVLQNIRDTDEAIAHLTELFPALQGSTFTIALNAKVIHNNTPLLNNQTIALMPPYSGG